MMQRSGPTANRHFTGSRPQELSIHLGLFSRLLLPLDLLDGFQHLQTWGLFSSFHTTSHAQLPVRIWLTSKCIPKKPTGFISPRPDQNIQRKSLGIRRPCFFFPEVVSISALWSRSSPQPKRTVQTGGFLVGVTNRWVESSCFSVAVSPGLRARLEHFPIFLSRHPALPPSSLSSWRWWLDNCKSFFWAVYPPKKKQYGRPPECSFQS